MGNKLGGGGGGSPCAVTHLTPGEKQAIRRTWTLFMKNIREDGPAVFMALFVRYPAYQKLFAPFADVDLSVLPNDPRLTAHAVSWAYFMTSIVDNLDDPPTLTELVRKLARNHHIYTVGPQHFEHMSGVIVQVFQDKLGKKMTPVCCESWGKMMEYVVQTVQSVSEEKEREEKLLEKESPGHDGAEDEGKKKRSKKKQKKKE
ncbi:hemoglobin subunit beta-like [Ornithodoros turicata]|uniref:hemoglobin subunit beta-like n=1 Tax=Ornithodoros turicata TaxID=34597 RepID=UPI00313A3430